MVEEGIAKILNWKLEIATKKPFFVVKVFGFDKNVCVYVIMSVWANQPTVHSGGDSKGRLCVFGFFDVPFFPNKVP